MKQRLKAHLALALGAAFISFIGSGLAPELAAAETIAQSKSFAIAANDQPPGAPQPAVALRSMFCQIDGRGNAPEYCQVKAIAEGQLCVCHRRLTAGATGATNAPGKSTLSPKGKLW